MATNVRGVERDRLWLMPPSMRDWLPNEHLAWFVLDVVAELDLAEFYAPYRADGRGGAVYDPALMLGVLVYAYCLGEHSSRRIERRLVEDVGFRVVAANQHPDHATLARFRARHQEAIAGLFAQVLGLCAAEGLVAAGVVAIDGTKLEANASAWSNRTRRQIADEILAEAARVDAAAELGERRGDELPERWASPTDRRARLREALRQLDERGASDQESYDSPPAFGFALVVKALVARRVEALGQAEHLARASLALGADILSTPDGLETLAGILGLQGGHDEAARHFGAAETHRRRTGTLRWPLATPEYEADIAVLREALGEEGFAKAWAEGAALSTEEAVAYATRGRG